MAASLTLTSATPYGLKYEYSYDGTGGGGSAAAARTQSEMISDLNDVQGPNPLQAFLGSTSDGPTFAGFPNGAEISLYVTPDNSANKPVSAHFNGIGTLSLMVNGTDGTAATAIIEVRFHHTFDR